MDKNTIKPELCSGCGEELHRGDCSVCDPWPEDAFNESRVRVS